MNIHHNQSITSILNELSRQQESLILEQLGGLVKEGLLVMKLGPSVIVNTPDPSNDKYTLSLKQQVFFELKDQEYINKLKAENAELKEKLKLFEMALRSV